MAWGFGDEGEQKIARVDPCSLVSNSWAVSSAEKKQTAATLFDADALQQPSDRKRLRTARLTAVCHKSQLTCPPDISAEWLKLNGVGCS